MRAYLTSGIMDGGVLMERSEGTPQGGPLSPLLANVLLDEVDKELERRGHCFVRYADDANVYVRSRRAGERVMALLLKLYGRLRLKVNEAKSAVASVFQRKFLGYSFWVAAGGKIKRRVAAKAMATFKAAGEETDPALRRSQPRTGGGTTTQLCAGLEGLLPTGGYSRRSGASWINGYATGCEPSNSNNGGAARPHIESFWQEGARPDVACMVAGNTRRLWRNSGTPLNGVLDLSWADQLGIPRLC